MGYKYVIESSAWAEYLGGTGKGEKVRQMIEHDVAATSVIAIVELADKFQRENQKFDTSLKFIKSRAAIIPITEWIALEAARLKKEIRSKHPKFGIADALHLATAMQEKAVLITFDADFPKDENVMLF
ncbi:PIN domain-containing protein [Candidatus Woesearchaeota archaeon]|nr:PIN domain-containing protein [Candidatus Woesearchaeota archaeon]